MSLYISLSKENLNSCIGRLLENISKKEGKGCVFYLLEEELKEETKRFIQGENFKNINIKYLERDVKIQDIDYVCCSLETINLIQIEKQNQPHEKTSHIEEEDEEDEEDEKEEEKEEKNSTRYDRFAKKWIKYIHTRCKLEKATIKKDILNIPKTVMQFRENIRKRFEKHVKKILKIKWIENLLIENVYPKTDLMGYIFKNYFALSYIPYSKETFHPNTNKTEFQAIVEYITNSFVCGTTPKNLQQLHIATDYKPLEYEEEDKGSTTSVFPFLDLKVLKEQEVRNAVITYHPFVSGEVDLEAHFEPKIKLIPRRIVHIINDESFIQNKELLEILNRSMQISAIEPSEMTDELRHFNVFIYPKVKNMHQAFSQFPTQNHVVLLLNKINVREIFEAIRYPSIMFVLNKTQLSFFHLLLDHDPIVEMINFGTIFSKVFAFPQYLFEENENFLKVLLDYHRKYLLFQPPFNQATNYIDMKQIVFSFLNTYFKNQYEFKVHYKNGACQCFLKINRVAFVSTYENHITLAKKALIKKMFFILTTCHLL